LIKRADLRTLLKHQRPGRIDDVPVEFSKADKDIYDYVLSNDLTMVPKEGLINTIMSAKHVVNNDLPGDFVECGVWRGGNALATKLVFDALGSDKTVWLFDTFKGMTAPTDEDVKIQSKIRAHRKHAALQEGDVNTWAYASFEEVENNFRTAGVELSTVRFVKGDVLETLREPGNLPSQISILRLDTDWYESTKAELEILYPLLISGGILIVDDYGHWSGAQKAVDEFFETTDAKRPFFQVVYITGTRSAVKL
jgi:hypothetical protein